MGLEDQIPKKPELPGRNYAPLLQGREMAWDNTIFYEFENSRMIRTTDWKYTWRFPSGPNELYDLRRDPDQWRNLVDDPNHVAARTRLRGRLDAFFRRYADPKYDLAKGGGSKTHLMTDRK